MKEEKFLEIDSIASGWAAVIAEAGKLIVSYNAAAQEKAWKKDVIKLLKQLNRKMDQIIDMLKRLDVKLDEKFREFVNNDLLSTIDVIDANTDYWRRSNDKYLYDRSTQEHIEKIYTGLQQKARMAMRYGYAHYDSLGLALGTEIYLVRLMRRQNYLKVTFEQYAEYFRDCLDEKETGSFGYLLKLLVQRMANTKASFPPGEFKNRKFKEGRTVYEEYVKITGSIDTQFGYTYRKVAVDYVDPDIHKQVTAFDEFTLSGTEKTTETVAQKYQKAQNNFLSNMVPAKEMYEVAIICVKNYLLICERGNEKFSNVETMELEETLEN